MDGVGKYKPLVAPEDETINSCRGRAMSILFSSRSKTFISNFPSSVTIDSTPVTSCNNSCLISEDIAMRRNSSGLSRMRVSTYDRRLAAVAFMVTRVASRF